MFDNFKKAILAKRIKKAVAPAANITGEGIVIYERTLHNILTLFHDIIQQAAPIIEDNADKIAEAVLILEPVIKDLSNMRVIQTLKNGKDLEERLEDQQVQQATENIEGYLNEFKAAIKEV